MNVVVAALNFVHGEFRSWVPPSLSRWRPLNDDQARQVAWLEVLIGRWGHLQVSDLAVGRKGSDLASYVDVFFHHAKDMQATISAYSAVRRLVQEMPNRGFKTPVPGRLAFPDMLEGCPLAEHLSPYSRGLYEEPAILRAGPMRKHTTSRPVSGASLRP